MIASHIIPKIVLASAMTTALTSTLIFAETPEPEVGKRWVLNAEFSDEFNGNTLDKTKWRDHHSTWKGRAPGKFEPSAVSVSNGSMQIRNHKLAVPDGKYTIAAGAVQSITKNAYHGYYEARLKTSRINMSTTFWLSNGNEHLLSPNNVNADCDDDKWSMELDIAEAVGGVIDKEWGKSFRNGQQYNVHVWYSDCSGNRKSFAKGANVAEGDGSKPVNNKLANGEEVWQNFNTFAAWWKNENDVQFYLNDNFSGKVKVSTALHNKPYSRPMGIQMLTETYNWATPYPTEEELLNNAINTSYYDWIRSYLYIGVNDVLDQVVTDPESINNGSTTLYTENFTIKNHVLTEDNLAVAFLYQINRDRDAEVVVFDGNNEVTRKKITLKAGYGHYLTDIDLSIIGDLVNPVFEINLMAVGQIAILTSTGKVVIAHSEPPAEIISTLSKDIMQTSYLKHLRANKVRI